MKKVSFIVAVTENNVIGKDNQMPWHLPDDMKWFKEHTSGCDVIMGKKTFYSLPASFRPLPKRKNIVITHSREIIEGCTMASSIDDALSKMDPEKENFVIGGGTIFNQFMPIVQKLYITRIHHYLVGDTFFPAINADEWKLTYTKEHPSDDKHAFDFTFQIFERVQS